ncbi:hypothetical protein CTAYLR_010691 [Chrysophaeum taylorii]|uniref:SWIM-type domain-containing protein n=1 Tax=Chrysophaeum taylorii TaxID=2483200 RepID=A0AAD7U5W0_9STRA|nr:hypothetical protein CTAYLR_010691 [Chrysophaeum taylorii]
MEQISVVTIGGGLDKVLLRRFTDEWTEKCPAFIEVWCPEYGLAKYEKKAGWIRARTGAPGTPRDNNGNESCNNLIKEDGTAREVVGVVPAWRSIINGRDWKEAQEYIHAGKLDGDFLKKVKSDSFVLLSSSGHEAVKGISVKATKSKQTLRFLCDFVVVAENSGLCHTLDGKSLDEALSVIGAAHVLKKAGPGHQSPTFYTCSCTKFWHYYKCKHVLALAIRLKHAQVPENTIILPFRKRGRGRGA